MKHVLITACFGFGLLVSGCGDQLTGETQKAIEQIKSESSKTASKMIEGLKTDTIGELKKMQGITEKDKPEKKSYKSGYEAAEK